MVIDLAYKCKWCSDYVPVGNDRTRNSLEEHYKVCPKKLEALAQIDGSRKDLNIKNYFNLGK